MILNMAGAGGSALKVISAASVDALPAAATEGTIGVITDVAISNFVIDFVTLSAPKEGTVFLSESKVSNVPINAAKDPNIVNLYPVTCTQYVSGVWLPKDFRIRKNNEWVTVETYLYSEGNEFTALTGGWDNVPEIHGSGGNAAVVKGDECLGVNCAKDNAGDHNCVVSTVNPIDLRNFTEINFDFTPAYNSDYGYSVEIFLATDRTNSNAYTRLLQVGTNFTNRQRTTRNISIAAITGSYYIRIINYAVTYGSQFMLYNVWLR